MVRLSNTCGETLSRRGGHLMGELELSVPPVHVLGMLGICPFAATPLTPWLLICE